jgi:large subunit ribosomal protein L25
MRRDGQLPAVIYGRHLEPIAISLEAHAAGLALSKLTSSSLVTIDLEGKEYPALVREASAQLHQGQPDHMLIFWLWISPKKSVQPFALNSWVFRAL